MNEVIQYIESKGIPYRIEGKECIIKCPGCMKDKLYVNIENQLFHCFHCETIDPESTYAKGHLSQLKETYGDVMSVAKITKEPDKEANFTDMVSRYVYELKNNKKALRYLMKRGFTSETIEKYQLGFTTRYNQEWLCIPSIENDIPKLLKLRKLPPDTSPELGKYIREKNSKSILFNGDAIDKFDTIMIVEGEIDALTLLQNGYENVVGITGGAGTLKSEWYDQLILKERLILILDSDEAGQKAAKNVWATRLGVNRVWNVLLPEDEDINSFFLKYTKESFDRIIKKASRWKVEGVVDLGEALSQLYQSSQSIDAVFPTPYSSLNKLLPGGGLQKTHLVTIGAPGGIGKTTMAMQICYHITKKYELPSLFICLEMPAKDLAVKVIQLDRDLSYKEIDPSDGLIYAQELEDLDMYFSYSSQLDVSMLVETTKVCRDRFGVGIVVLDNLQLMVRSQEHMDYALVSQKAKQLAMDLDMIFVLISQPTKLAGRSMTSDDLKGTSAVHADSDEILIINRKREGGEDATVFSNIAKCILDKNRYGSPGKFNLNLIGEKSRFEEITI